MLILGISCGHDANICILDGTRILIHLEKERFTRKRHDAGSVDDLICTALDCVGVSLDQIELIATSIPVWPEHGVSGRMLSGKVYESIFEFSEHTIELMGKRFPAIYVPHHVGHMAYSYYLSGFDSADLIAVDGYGNFTATAIGTAEGNQLRAVYDIPSSVGSLWSIVSQYLFNSLLDAGKTMGLAPYGRPKYVELLREKYYSEKQGFPIIDDPWKDVDRVPILSQISDRRNHMREEFRDMAASVQVLTNEVMLDYARCAKERLGSRNLCLSGGVALNGIANSLIEKSGLYENIYIGPATNDGGLSLGFALYALHHVAGYPRPNYEEHVYLGKNYDEKDLFEALGSYDSEFKVQDLPFESLITETAKIMAAGGIVGWYQGRSESGPRALGHRSILCHPGIAKMKDLLNNRVKHRDSFRPFAPSVLRERAAEYFDLQSESPYMLKVVDVTVEQRAAAPAIVHVDGTSRPQTVASDAEVAPFRKLIEAFEAESGLPMLLNTSFNTRGQPIVESPADALDTFATCEMDALAIMNCLITKNNKS